MQIFQYARPKRKSQNITLVANNSEKIYISTQPNIIYDAT